MRISCDRIHVTLPNNIQLKFKIGTDIILLTEHSGSLSLDDSKSFFRVAVVFKLATSVLSCWFSLRISETSASSFLTRSLSPVTAALYLGVSWSSTLISSCSLGDSVAMPNSIVNKEQDDENQTNWRMLFLWTFIKQISRLQQRRWSRVITSGTR